MKIEQIKQLSEEEIKGKSKKELVSMLSSINNTEEHQHTDLTTITAFMNRDETEKHFRTALSRIL